MGTCRARPNWSRPDRVIRDRIVSMDQVEAELPKLAMASNDLHHFINRIRVDRMPSMSAATPFCSNRFRSQGY